MTSTSHNQAARSGELLDVYLAEIRGDALLNAEEETILALAIARGDSAARSRVISANLRLVVKIARDYGGRGLSMDDLIGEGNLGLIRATEEFDPTYGTRFSTYAGYWIKQAIRHALTNTTATIRLPAHMVGLMSKWRKADRQLSREFGRRPSEEEIAIQLGLTEAQIEMVRRARQSMHPQTESGANIDGHAWSADEAADQHESPEDRLELDDERSQIVSRLSRLEPRERRIVSLRFGLDGGTPMTLKQIGQTLGVTREWVRKIELKALQRLMSSDPQALPEPTPTITHTNRAAVTRNRRRVCSEAPTPN